MVRNAKRKLAYAAAAFTLLASPVLAQTAASNPIKIPTIEELSKSPRFSSFTVSKDGKYIAAIERVNDETKILVWDAANLAAPPNALATKTMKFRGIEFTKGNKLFVSAWQPFDLRFEDVTKTFATKFLLTDVKGEKWSDPIALPAPKSRTDALEQALSNPSILDELENDPEHVLIINNFGPESGDIYKVNIINGKSEKVLRSPDGVGNYVTDLEGNIRARDRVDTDKEGFFIATEIKNDKGNWEEHFRFYAKSRNIQSVIGFSKDPNIAYLVSNVGRDKTAIYEYDVANRKIGEIIFAHNFFDAVDLDVGKKRNKPNFGEIGSFYYAGPRLDEEIVDSKAAQLDATLRAALKINKDPLTIVDPETGKSANVEFDVDNYYEIIAKSDDGNVVVIRVEGPKKAPIYYLFKDKKQLSVLANPHPQLDSRAFGSETLVYYKARDGLDIPAFLHKPNPELFGPGPYPTVIMPHGGPWARDELAWDWSMWPQMLNSRGYAVLQPQYRGTADGWGKKLWMAGDAKWGLEMQDDKDDGAKWLIEKGIARADSIAMFGFSYGGYSAMAASVRPNGIYKCAIAGAGVSNIETIWADFYRNPYFREAQGPFVKGMSPAKEVDKISIPILVYHGDRDQTVPLIQSLDFVDRAKKAGKNVKYVQIADYAHGPGWLDAARKQELQIIEDYLKNDCGLGVYKK